MNIHNWIRDIPNWVMGINDSLMDVNVQLCMSIVEFWISIISNNDHRWIVIIELWSSKTQLLISIIREFAFGFPYSTHLPMPRIYCSFIHFILSFPAQRSWIGVYWFHLARLSVCGQNRVRCVSSTVLTALISYLHILSTNFRRCRALSFVKNSKILAISLILHLSLCLVSMLCEQLKSWFLIRVVIATTFNFLWWYL